MASLDDSEAALSNSAANGQSSGSNQTLSEEEKLSEAHQLKSAGNEKYKEKQYKLAIGKYHRALLYLRGIGQATSLGSFMGLVKEAPVVSADVQMKVVALQVDCYNNLAACILQQENPNYEKVVLYCDKALHHSDGNVKANYRKGVAYYYLHDYDQSHSCLMYAKEHKGSKKDPVIDKYLALCEKEKIKEDKNMKATYKGMFNKLSSNKGDEQT